MPPRKKPVLENPTAKIILSELSEYAQTRQFYPNQYALFSYLTKPKFNKATRQYEPAPYPDLKLWKYDYWFERLVDENYIEIDQDATRSIRCVHLEIVKREGDNLEL